MSKLTDRIDRINEKRAAARETAERKADQADIQPAGKLAETVAGKITRKPKPDAAAILSAAAQGGPAPDPEELGKYMVDLWEDHGGTGPVKIGDTFITEPAGFIRGIVKELHTRWQDAGEVGPHPARELVQEWQNRPTRVAPQTRKDKRIFPRIEAIPPDAVQDQANLFMGRIPELPDTQGQMTLFPEHNPTRVPLLDLVDATGMPIRAQGRGAPWALRFGVQSLLSVDPKDRGDAWVTLPLKLGDIADFMQPNNFKKGKHWQKLRQMLLTMTEYRVIFPDGGVWMPWAIRYVPADYHPDATIQIGVSFPPGAVTGPTIDMDALKQLGVKSSPEFRAYLAAASIGWIPGKTRVPGGGRHHMSRNIEDYPVITKEERRALAFGPGDKGDRTDKSIDRHWENLPGFVVADKQAMDPKSGAVGWRIVPDFILPDDAE